MDMAEPAGVLAAGRAGALPAGSCCEGLGWAGSGPSEVDDTDAAAAAAATFPAAMANFIRAASFIQDTKPGVRLCFSATEQGGGMRSSNNRSVKPRASESLKKLSVDKRSLLLRGIIGARLVWELCKKVVGRTYMVLPSFLFFLVRFSPLPLQLLFQHSSAGIRLGLKTQQTIMYRTC